MSLTLTHSHTLYPILRTKWIQDAHTLTQISILLLFLVHTMNELKLTGNCLLGSRPLLSFDPVRLLLQEIAIVDFMLVVL